MLDDIISRTLLRTRVKRSAIPLKLKIENFVFFLRVVVRFSTVCVCVYVCMCACVCNEIARATGFATYLAILR